MYKVLIVDDEPAVSEGLSLMVNWEEHGFVTLDSAENGEEALEILKKTRYNLLITDIRMPVMNGLELIREVRSLMPSIPIVILSGYDEFNYAKKAIEYGAKAYLLKPVNRMELSQLLQDIKEELDKDFTDRISNRENNRIARDKFLFDLISGNLTQKETLIKGEEFNFDEYNSNYCVALLEIQDFHTMVEDSLEDAKLTKFSVRNIVEEIVLDKKIGFVCDYTDGLLAILFCRGKSELQYSDIDECLNTVCSIILKYLNIKVTIGYGNLVEPLTELKACKKLAQNALERKFIVGDHSVIPYSSVTIDEALVWQIEWDNQLLLSAVENMDSNTVENEIAKLTDEIISKRISENIISSLLYNTIFGLCAIIKQNGGDADKIFNMVEIQDLLNNLTIEKFKVWLFSACTQTANYIFDFSRNKSTKVISQIKKYIDENFYQDLSIKQISSMFFLNSAYLGQLFKNTIGESFSDYLNKKKISEVKKLMVSDDYKIQDILETVGYKNQGYFYKKFKAYEGIPFAEYNEGLRKRKKDSSSRT